MVCTLYPGWYLLRVVCTQGGDLYSRSSLLGVVSTQCDLYSGWSVLRVVSTQSGLSSVLSVLREVSESLGTSFKVFSVS